MTGGPSIEEILTPIVSPGADLNCGVVVRKHHRRSTSAFREIATLSRMVIYCIESPRAGAPPGIWTLRGGHPARPYKVGFQAAGEGPLLVLLHGITSTSDAAGGDAEARRALHGDRPRHDRPRPLGQAQGGLLAGAYAAGVRDLLAVLASSAALSSATRRRRDRDAIRLPLSGVRGAAGAISSGGLGKEVHPLLRAACLPGSEWVLPLLAREWSVRAGDAVRSVAAKLGLEAGPDLAEFARGYASLIHDGARDAFLDTMRSVIGPEGQKVSALDRLYLADQLPFLLIWGDEDPVIPVDHGRSAHELVAHSRYVEIEGSGHWPMLDAPERIVRELIGFIEETEPFEWSLSGRAAAAAWPGGLTDGLMSRASSRA